MLDDLNVLSQRDPEDALGVAASLYKQAGYAGDLVDADHDGRLSPAELAALRKAR